MPDEQMTKVQQKYAQWIAEVNADYGRIVKFIPADDGVNVYFQFTDGRLWYSNNSFADGYVIPVSHGPERHA